MSEMQLQNTEYQKATEATHMTEPYRKLLMEKCVPVIQIKPRPAVIHLREETAIIPLQTTAPQQDPRKSVDISFLDIVDNYNGDSEEPTTNGLANQPIYVERTPSLIHTENLVKIPQLEIPQNSPHTSGKSQNEEISTEKTCKDLDTCPFCGATDTPVLDF